MMHSSTVKIRKRHIIRTGDMFHMNNKFKKKLPPKPCISCKAAAAAGRPVNPIHRLKFLEGETDFAFEGILPLVWSRSYYSDQDGIGWLGEGWSVPGCPRIIRDAADWPISTIRVVCSRCRKSMKTMRNRYCSKASRSGSVKSGRSVAQNAAVVGIAAGGFARLRRGCPGWQSAGPLRIQCQRRPAARHRPRRRGQTQLRL